MYLCLRTVYAPSRCGRGLCNPDELANGDGDGYAYCDGDGYSHSDGDTNSNGYADPNSRSDLMQAGPTFSDVLAQPGPSAPAQPPTAAGGVSLNNAAKQVAMSNPIQQARIRTLTSLDAVKKLATDTAMGMTGGL